MFKDIFQERMQELFREQGKSATAMAKEAGISPASMNYYLTGERRPDATALYKICSTFHVSADWLFGLSDVRTTSTNIQTACKTLHMSEKAVNAIMATNIYTPLCISDNGKEDENENGHGVISYLFEMNMDRIYKFAEALNRYVESRNSMNLADIETSWDDCMAFSSEHYGSVVLSGYDATDYYAQNVYDRFYELISNDLLQAEYKRKEGAKDNG